MDRRTTLQWMLAAAAAVPALSHEAFAQGAGGAAESGGGAAGVRGYGTDPDLLKTYAAGELWPLTLTVAQRKTASALCDLIIPAEGQSPGASAVGVVNFIDEWISAPYPLQRQDRKTVLDGFGWLDREASRRFRKGAFADLGVDRMRSICDEICYLPRATEALKPAARFFARYRDLTAGGFYTTPAGRADVKFVGDVPRATFEGPPIEVLRKVGLA